MKRLREFWLGEVDLAPLSLFRVLYGIQLFNWIWQLWPNLYAFFSDEGILPRQELVLHFGDRFSLLTSVGETWQVAVFWALSLCVAVLLTVGWRSRLMSFLAFVVVASFSFRNPLILDGSDLVFRFAPLWMAFADCGARFSVDALARADRRQPTGRGFALPVRILELQVAWIYLATGIEKMAGTLWPTGGAAYYSLQLEHTFGRWWARPIATTPVLAAITTYWTIFVEHAFLPLAMLPSRITRLIAVAMAASLHLGILTLMNVGNFPVIMLSTLVLFLPPSWIEAVAGRFSGAVRSRVRPRALAFADGVAQSAAHALPVTAYLPARSRTVERAALGVALLALAIPTFATAVPRQWEALRPKDEFGELMRFLSLDQRWDMFSPDPAQSDGWMTMPAFLADGTEIDLLTGKPPDSAEGYSDPLYSRWAKVQERIANVGYTDYRLEYARQFCRQRNLHLSPGEAPIETFEVHYIERVIQPPGEGPPKFIDHDIWEHHC